MRPHWEDVNARARGLATHLIGRDELERLARAPDLATLAARLRADGILPGDAAPFPDAIDLAARRAAAGGLHVLARWCGPRTQVMAVVFEDEDRRSIRALIRGAAALAPQEERLAGLLPTPALPERALEELARQGGIAQVASLLAVWRHPLAVALQPEASAAHPSLFRLDHQLNRSFAVSALAAARRAGRNGPLHRFVQETVDLDNVATAFVLLEHGQDVRPGDVFLAGGRHIPRDVFEAAVATRTPTDAAERLAAALGSGPASDAVRRSGSDPAGLAAAVLRARIRTLEGVRRRSPLSPLVLIGYALALRAQVLDLRRITWGVAMAAPPGEIVRGLVSR